MGRGGRGHTGNTKESRGGRSGAASRCRCTCTSVRAALRAFAAACSHDCDLHMQLTDPTFGCCRPLPAPTSLRQPCLLCPAATHIPPASLFVPPTATTASTQLRINIMGAEVGYFHYRHKGVDWVFVDHPSYPRPGGLYADEHGVYGDNQVGQPGGSAVAANTLQLPCCRLHALVAPPFRGTCLSCSCVAVLWPMQAVRSSSNGSMCPDSGWCALCVCVWVVACCAAVPLHAAGPRRP